jgi:uncharacterized protein
MWYSKISKAICISILVAVILPGIGNAQQNNPESMDSGHGPDRERSQKDYWPFPNPDAGYVSDHANLLSDEEQEKIERWLWQIESKTGVEIIVMTIYSIDDYAGTPNDSIEEFATALFNTYGIGNMPANNGVLLLVAVSDRKIMNSVITPKFKNADYAEGITDGVKAIALEFAQARIGLNWPLIVLLAAVPILVLIAISLFMSGKRGWGWVCIGLLLLVLLAIFFVVRKTLKHMPRSSSSSWSSGGLGGFGGGFSGGGGATGSW